MKAKAAGPAVKLEFDAKLNPAGPNRTWCHLHFPGDFVKTFGTRARVPVAGTINGFPFRSSFSPMGGKYMLCVNKEMQAGANVKPGDHAHFVLQRDDQPRTVTIPPALKKALAANPAAKRVFDQLSYSHKKEYAVWIAGAKQAETVQRRLGKLIPMLLAKKSARA
jgi:hypothetical protein